MVKISKKKEIESVRAENELNVENKYEEIENRELTKEESDILSKWLNALDRLWMSNLENEWRSWLKREEVVAILNSLID